MCEKLVAGLEKRDIRYPRDTHEPSDPPHRVVLTMMPFLALLRPEDQLRGLVGSRQQGEGKLPKTLKHPG